MRVRLRYVEEGEGKGEGEGEGRGEGECEELAGCGEGLDLGVWSEELTGKYVHIIIMIIIIKGCIIY